MSDLFVRYILFPILGGLVGYFLPKALNIRATRIFLGIRGTEHVYIALPTTIRIAPNTEYATIRWGVPATTGGVVQAFAYVHRLLERAGYEQSQIHLHFDEQLPASAYKENLVIIGFGKTNTVSRAIESKLDLPYAFKDQKIIDVKSGNTIAESIHEAGKVTRDYGMLTVSSNPFNRRKKVIMFGGCQSFGVTAAASLFDPDNVYRLWFQKKNSQAFAHVLVKAKLFTAIPYLFSLLRKSSNYQAIVECSVINNSEISVETVIGFAQLPRRMPPQA
jgi:hypothetical protein